MAGQRILQLQPKRYSLAGLPTGHHAISQFNRLGVSPSLRGCAISYPHGYGGVEFFPDPGYRHHNVRRYLAQIVEQRGQAFAQMHDDVVIQRTVEGEVALQGSAHGQEAELVVTRLAGTQLPHCLHLEHQVAVREQGALRGARAARGVDDGGNIVGASYTHLGLPAIRMVAIKSTAGLQHCLEISNQRMRQGMQTTAIKKEDFLDAGHLAQYGQGLLELGLILHKEPACRAVLDRLCQMGCGIGVVQPDRLDAHTHRPEFDLTPLGAHVGQHDGPVTASTPHGQQAQAKRSHRLGVIGPSDVIPEAQVVPAQGHASLALSCHAPETGG